MRIKPSHTSLLLLTAVAIVIHVFCWLGSRSGGPVLFSFAAVCVLLSFLFTASSRMATRMPLDGHLPSLSATPASRHGGQSAGVPARQVTAREAWSPSTGAGRAALPVPQPFPRNAFTIDLEDYFHTQVASRSISYAQWSSMPSRVEVTTHRLLDLLDQHQVTATVFVLGWVARRHARLVQEVARRGHEIACHSYRHRLVFSLARDEFREDTRTAKSVLESVTGEEVVGYRAPSFSITPGTEWAFDALAELGFQYDSSVNPIWHPLYAQPHAARHPYTHASGLVEFPIASCSIAGMHLPIGGGAYLRLLPYLYTRAGLAVVNHLEGRSATLYVHPWEIDSFQPLVPQDWRSRVRQTWGTSTMEKKLSALLRSSSFGPIRQVYAAELAPGRVPAGLPEEHARTLLRVN